MLATTNFGHVSINPQPFPAALRLRKKIFLPGCNSSGKENFFTPGVDLANPDQCAQVATDELKVLARAKLIVGLSSLYRSGPARKSNFLQPPTLKD